MTNGLVDLVVVPELGGRVIQLRLGSGDFLYVNPRHRGRVYGAEENCSLGGWKNYGGSKVWPAPQGWDRKDQWPGPPDPILDGGAYACRVIEDSSERLAIHLESPPDPYTGLIFSRVIELAHNSSAVRILHTIKNLGSRPVRWSIWQVTQQPADPVLVISARARRHRQIFGDRPFDRLDVDPRTGLWKLTYRNQVAKFAIEAEEGWLLSFHPGRRLALIEEFPLFPGEAYPDGAPAQVWVNGKGTYSIPGRRINMGDDPNGCDPYIETEVLSPLVALNPGQQYHFPIRWRLTSVPSDANVAIKPYALLSAPLAVRRKGGKLQVTCQLGIFQASILEIALLCRDEVCETIPLGIFTPLEPCCISLDLTSPAPIESVRLQMRDTGGQFCRTIDECRVPDSG